MRSTPLPLVSSPVVVLSPHLDDAVLSCGGLIADLDSAHVVTVFNGPAAPPVPDAASRFHARCGHTDENAMAERQKEDDRALRMVEAATTRLGLREALYRRDADGTPSYASDTAIFVDDIPAVAPELAMVTDAIRGCVETLAPGLVLAPLGIGGHVDHLLVAAAARRLEWRVLQYEDVPYVLDKRFRGWEERVRLRRAFLHRCTARGWSAKLAGIEQYESQREVLWHAPDAWREDLSAYARAVGGGGHGERLWSTNDR